MKLKTVFCSLVASTALLAGSASATVTVAGINFADNAFADTLISSSGTFTTSGGSLNTVLTDHDVGTYAFSFSPGASVNMGFSSVSLFNGAGADLAIFELGLPDSFRVTINGVDKTYLSAGTGFMAGGFNVNVAKIDFSDFGLASGATINSVVIGLDIHSGSGTVPSLSMVAGLNVSPVPESETYAMMLAGLGLLGVAARRRQQRK